MTKRIFISFAIEDSNYRHLLVGQARHNDTPFEWIDMSVKEPHDEEEWQKKCRTRIKRCHGMIVLLSKRSYHSSGLRFEVKCAKEEGIPLLGVHVKKNDHGADLPELYRKKKVNWTWENIRNFIDSL